MALAVRAVGAVRGRFSLNRKAIDEHEGAWRAIATFHLHAPAPSATVTFQFDWRQHVDFEREGEQERRRPVSPPRLLTEELQLDFTDPKGKVGSEARVDVALSRDRDFRAGEWSLEVRGPDGPIGTRTPVTLRGSNPPK
jgi:hypothetical protein